MDQSRTSELDLSHGGDKGIMALPQIQFLELLIARLRGSQHVEDEAFHGTVELLDMGDTAFDIIIENQRGTMFFGISLFSQNSLITPVDPPVYQTLKGDPIPDLKLIPLPDFHWQWAWPHWSIAMIGDVDEDGFVYSHVRFSSKRWKGVYKFGNFVRRRIWIRRRDRIHPITSSRGPSTQMLASNSSISDIKLRKRDRLRRRLKRKKNRQQSADGIELIDELDDEYEGSIIPENSSDSSIYSDLLTDLELNPLDALLESIDRITSLKLDRERIEAFLQLILNSSIHELDLLALNAPHNYLHKITSSLDHFSSKEILLKKLQTLASSSEESTSSQITTIIHIIQNLNM